MKIFLILHGWGSSSKDWSEVQKIIESKGYNVIVPDLPGFGENVFFEEENWFLDDYVDWVENFCEKKEISEFFLVGHSFGGAVAAKFASKNPQKIKKLFLIANSGIRKKTFKKNFLKKATFFFRPFSFLPFYDFFQKIFYKIFGIKSDYLNAKNNFLKKTYLNIIKDDISDVFSSILTPTVIVWGEKDSFVPIQDAYFIHKEIKGSELIVIPGRGHNLGSKYPELLVEKILKSIS